MAETTRTAPSFSQKNHTDKGQRSVPREMCLGDAGKPGISRSDAFRLFLRLPFRPRLLHRIGYLQGQNLVRLDRNRHYITLQWQVICTRDGIFHQVCLNGMVEYLTVIRAGLFPEVEAALLFDLVKKRIIGRRR